MKNSKIKIWTTKFDKNLQKFSKFLKSVGLHYFCNKQSYDPNLKIKDAKLPARFQKIPSFPYISTSKNKTAGYHRHTLRLPIFVKKAFKKKTFFSRKSTLSSSQFLICPKFKTSWFFFKKKPQSGWKTSLRNKTIWCAFFRKAHLFSQKRP